MGLLCFSYYWRPTLRLEWLHSSCNSVICCCIQAFSSLQPFVLAHVNHLMYKLVSCSSHAHSYSNPCLQRCLATVPHFLHCKHTYKIALLVLSINAWYGLSFGFSTAHMHDTCIHWSQRLLWGPFPLLQSMVSLQTTHCSIFKKIQLFLLKDVILLTEFSHFYWYTWESQ